VPERFLRVAHQRLALVELAARHLEGGAQVGEGVSGLELSACLVQVEPNDRKQGERRDPRQEHDVGGAVGPVAGHPGDQVGQRERAEDAEPSHVRDEERIPRLEPGAQRGGERGARVRRLSEGGRQRFAILKAHRRVARQAAIDRRREGEGEARGGPAHPGRHFVRLPHEERREVCCLERQPSAHAQVSHDA